MANSKVQTARFCFNRRQLLGAFFRGGLNINLTFPADHHLEYHCHTSQPDVSVDVPALDRWKYERAQAKAMMDAQGPDSLAAVLPLGRMNWQQQYRYYDSLIKSYEATHD